MKELKWLILCLLVAFKVTSQTITPKNKYVCLNEKQAREVIKDLIHLDALKEVNGKLEGRIDIFLQKEIVYQEVLKNKDSIISSKNEIIELKDKIINAKKPIEFHSYIGYKTFNLEWLNPIFYGKAQFELKKLNLGAQINLQPNAQHHEVYKLNYNIFVEYKLF